MTWLAVVVIYILLGSCVFLWSLMLDWRGRFHEEKKRVERWQNAYLRVLNEANKGHCPIHWTTLN